MSSCIGIDITAVVCPKCGKRHFTVEQNHFGDAIPAIFRFRPDPEYKDGILQNPPEVTPSSQKFKCLECGFEFEVVYEPGKAYKYIDLAKERKKLDKIRLAAQKEEDERIKKLFGISTQKKRGRKPKKHEGLATGCSGDAASNNVLTVSDQGSCAENWILSPITSVCKYILGNGTKSEIDLGGVLLKLHRTYSEEEIANIKNTFGWDVKNLIAEDDVNGGKK